MNKAQINCTAKPDSTVVYPLDSQETVVDWISENTGQYGWMYKPSAKKIKLNWPSADSEGLSFFEY